VSVWIDITVTVHFRDGARSATLWYRDLIQRSFIETISQSIFFREALPSTHSILL